MEIYLASSPEISYDLHMPAIPTVPINGDTVKALRLASGLSQRQLGAEAGVVQSHISDIENGEQPSELVAHRIARALSVPVKAILRVSTESGGDAA